MVLGEGVDGEDLAQLDNVGDFELFELEIRVEDTVVELAEEAERVSFREILFLAVINSKLIENLGSVVSSLGLWDSVEVVLV